MPADDQDRPAATVEIASGAAPSTAADHASVAAQLRGVDDALERLGELPVDARVAVFTDLHQQLTAALAVTATAAGPVDEDPPRQRPGSAHRSR